MFNKLITITVVMTAMASFTSMNAAELAAQQQQPYKAVARPDIAATNQLWGEFFTLPDGFNQYDNGDFAEKGLTFTYTCTNPDLVKVTNCGWNPDPEVTFRKNNITWYIEPMAHGEATLSVTAHYDGKEVTASRDFIIADVPSPIFEPAADLYMYNLNGVRRNSRNTQTLYMSSFFKMPQGWNVASEWENLGITWGVETDNTDLISAISTTADGNYGKIEVTIEPITGSGTLTAWAERDGVRVEAAAPVNFYACQAKDDEAYLPLADGASLDVDVLANDSWMTDGTTVEIDVLNEPKYGRIETCSVETWNGMRPALRYTVVSAEGVPSWSPDPVAYRLTLKDAEGNVTETSDATINVVLRPNPAIARIHEFVAAPGQFTNNLYDASRLIGAAGGSGTSSVPATTGMVSLGTFGGYIVFGFDGPVYNDPRNPYGVDFTIAGNAFKGGAKGYWSEPGAVQVMRDDNGNGLPDDTWYELAGSDYWFKSTRRNITRTYYDPGYASRYPVYFTTSDGETGAVPTNQFHGQSYFPDKYCYPDAQIVDGTLTLGGSLILGTYDRSTPSYIETYRPFAFGYCDNHATNGDISTPVNPYYAETKADGTVVEPTDGFDISWAVDKDGNHVELDHIDFVKVYNAIDENCGWLGESSTEVAGFSMTRPDFSQTAPGDYYINYANITQLMVELGKTCQYEGLAFHNGRPMFDAKATWTVDDPEIGTIDENGIFTARKVGYTKVRFSATELAPADSFDVEVVELDGVVISPEGNASAAGSEMSMLVGDRNWLNTESTVRNGSSIYGANANRFIYDTYTWTCSDPTVIEVDNWGSLLALKTGEVTLTVRSNSHPELSADIKVSVIDNPEIKRACNYLVVEDASLTQEDLNAKTYTCRDIFNASYQSNKISYFKNVDMKLVSVEPAEYADKFYIENNRLMNRLELGDYREYMLTIEGTMGGATETFRVPFLHTSSYNTISAPTVNENAELIVDLATRQGSLDLADVFVPGGYEGLYKSEYRLACDNSFPEDAKVEISAEGILSFSYDTAEMPDVKTIEVEGRISRAAQKAASFDPVSPTWIKVAVTVRANEVVGIEEVEDNALRVFPNPATYAFTLNNSEPVAISLYTAGGLPVGSMVLNPGEAVDVSALPAGLYMVVTADGNALRLIKK